MSHIVFLRFSVVFLRFSLVSLRVPYLSNTKVLEPGDRLLRAYSKKAPFPFKRQGQAPETADGKRAKV